MLGTSIKTFRKRFGRYPKVLDDLQEKNPNVPVPPHPYEDRQWRYDPATGEVR
jgi:hypothetical protein